MKNKQKGFIVPFLIALIAVLLVGGGTYVYLNKKTVEPVTQESPIIATSTTSIGSTQNPSSTIQQTNTPTNISVVGMSQYTDSDFGFSFWYPNSWSVKDMTGKSLSPLGDAYNGPAGSKVLRISNGTIAIDIHEYSSANDSIIDYPNPAAGNDPVEYYFDATSHTWMQRDLGSATQDSAADVSVNTMGGLHMLTGAMRFQYDTIVPLSAQHFLIVAYLGDAPYSSDDINQIPFVKTIVATDLSVAMPWSTALQTQTIQAEAKAYGVLK